MTNRTTIITDASWCPETGVGGWAAWITVNYEGEVTRLKASGVFKKNPNSSLTAEVWALENGIYLARMESEGRILAQSDCAGALKRIEARHPDITVRHVKGHTSKKDARSWVNRWCDEQAGKRMREARQQLTQKQPCDSM